MNRLKCGCKPIQSAKQQIGSPCGHSYRPQGRQICTMETYSDERKNSAQTVRAEFVYESRQQIAVGHTGRLRRISAAIMIIRAMTCRFESFSLNTRTPVRAMTAMVPTLRLG